MKKVVVLFPYLDTKGTLGQKTFEVVTEEEYLEANNTDTGCLIIICKANLPKYQPITLAVFKDWIYWERINEEQEEDDEYEPEIEAEKRIVEKK